MMQVTTPKRDRSPLRLRVAGVLAATAIALLPVPSAADQGGISFWLPGAFGSLAAVPGQPGWALGTIYYHSSVDAGGNVAASRAIRLGNRTTNLTVNLNATLDGNVDVALIVPSYTFASPVLGGQLTTSLMAVVGNSQASIDATVTGALGPIGFAASRSVSDSLFSAGDLF
jgi:hypothetical protein